MAAGLVTESDISSYVQTIFADAMFVARDNNLMAARVTVFGDRTGLAARSSSEYGTATMQSVGEVDDLTSQTFTPAVLATLTPGEVGAQFFITDSRLESDPFAVRNDASTELGMSAAQKIETDLLGNFSSLTGGTVGAAGTAITWGYFFAALSQLRGQKAPLPYTCVIHPYTWHVLGKAIAPGATVTNSPRIQDAVAANFFVGNVSGVDIYTSANIASGTAVYGAMFARSALALDIRRAARLEPERDASRRGWELNLSAVYAQGVWRPKFGVQMLFDASVPTS